MGWLRLRVGPKRRFDSPTWHLDGDNGSTLCGFLVGDRAIAGEPKKYERRCRLCTVVDQHEKEEDDGRASGAPGTAAS